MSSGRQGKHGPEREYGAQSLPENPQLSPEELRHFIAKLETEIRELESMNQEMQGERGPSGGYQHSISQKDVEDVKQQFDALRQIQWKEAFAHLGNFSMKTEDRYGFLNSIMKDAAKCMAQKVDEIYDKLLLCKSGQPASSPDRMVDIPKEITEYLKAGVKEGDWNGSYATEFVKNQMQKEKGANFSKDSPMITYLEACCKLGWTLALQRPRMYLLVVKEKERYDPNVHEVDVNNQANIGKDSKIRCYAMPGVTQGKSLVIKPTVLLKP